ncbi:hypothetical protein BHM03_00013704 [Ensete ventricosum]|nr:hypothetical protein BHM03_00013704 [Ensete ventricosum]
MGGMTSTMAARFAFFPPDPPSYRVVVEDEASGRLSMTTLTPRQGVEVRRLWTRRGSGIIAMYVTNPNAKLTLLYSHGNAADLGQMYELFVGLSNHLRVNLMGVLTHGILRYRAVRSVSVLYRFGSYQAYRAGTEDNVVDCSHGKRLWELCKEKYEPLWIKGGNHNNLELFPDYIRHLKKFISAIENLPVRKDESVETSDVTEAPRTSSDRLESSRLSIDQTDMSRSSTVSRDKPKRGTESRGKSRPSTDRREKSRRSVDSSKDMKDDVDQPEKPRKSSDRSDET